MRKFELSFLSFFFFNDTATTEIYTLPLHDALPISGHEHVTQVRRLSQHRPRLGQQRRRDHRRLRAAVAQEVEIVDRKSTRLNSSHSQISYAVFCLKKKKITQSNHNSVKT